MTDDEIELIATCHPSRLIGWLLEQAAKGDSNEATELLHAHIHSALEYGVVLDDRLVDYVAKHGLPKKTADTYNRDVAIAIAVIDRAKGVTIKAICKDFAARYGLFADTINRIYKKNKSDAIKLLGEDTATKIKIAKETRKDAHKTG